MTITLTLLELLGWAVIMAIAFLGAGAIVEYWAAGVSHEHRHHPKEHR